MKKFIIENVDGSEETLLPPANAISELDEAISACERIEAVEEMSENSQFFTA